MAGHRQRTGRPKQRRTRADNWRARLDERLALARTPVEQVTGAFEFVRAVMSNVPAELAAPAADRLARDLIATAEDLIAANIKRRSNDCPAA